MTKGTIFCCYQDIPAKLNRKTSHSVFERYKRMFFDKHSKNVLDFCWFLEHKPTKFDKFVK